MNDLVTQLAAGCLVVVPLLAGSAGETRSPSHVIVWGDNNVGQCDIPPLPPGLTYVAVTAGAHHSLAIRSDGSAVAWGLNLSGQCDVPALPPGLSYVEVAAGTQHTVARRSDGSVVAWGYNVAGQCNVPAPLTAVEVAAGGEFSLARRADGTVVAWGFPDTVPSLPPGLSYTGIDARANHRVFFRSDGALLGNVWWGFPTLPAETSVAELGIGAYHTVARLEGAPCGGAFAYCAAAPNSVSSSGAKLGAHGCAGHAVNTLAFDVADLPPSTLGLFVYGPSKHYVALGNGFLCIGGPTTRVLPPALANPGGSVTYPVDLTLPPFVSGPGQVLAGSTWDFQLWYRDPAAGGAGSNLSNGLQVVFAP